MIPLRLRLVRETNRIVKALLWITALGKSKQPRVYLFHDIMDAPNLVTSQFQISKHSFERFLASQLNTGAKAINFDQLKDEIQNDTRDNKFIVTFDDANTSVYTKAYPFLKAHNIPFIVFITKELIDQPNFLTTEQIHTLAQEPLCTIGSHACNHKMFRYLTKEQVAAQLIESKSFLENTFNVNVECFAFPYGRLVEVSCKNIRQVKKGPYLFAFAALSGLIKQHTFLSKAYIPRINVDEKLSNT